MKKIIISSILLLFLISCEKSKKGRWIKSEKDLARKELLQAMSSSGSELRAVGINLDKFCDCLVDKIENKFESYNALAKIPVRDRYKIGEEMGADCAEKIYTDSIK